MKKFYSVLAIVAMFIMSVVNANAQMVGDANLDNYVQKQFGSNINKVIGEMNTQSMLDNNGCLSLSKEISAPGMTKDQLYVEMANWFICNYDNSIQFADKEQGTIIARPYIENIARSAGGFNAYDISICPTVRVKVEDGKLLVNYSLRDYNVVEQAGGGNAATALAAGLAVATVASAVAVAASDTHTETVHVTHHGFGPFHTTEVHHYVYHPHRALEDALLLSCIASSANYGPSKDSKAWSLANCYPFVKKDSHKKASTKAFVMANAYSQAVVNNIEAAINQCSLACK